MTASRQTQKRGWEWLRLSQGHGWPMGLLLAFVTLAAYLPAVNGKFVWDDDAWTVQISGLLQSFSGLVAMWVHPTALQQYYPLTGTSFWIDHQLWGYWPPPYHVENILLHALAAFLFGKLLCRLAVPGAWLAAAVFALHPLMVESVAWITERKNTLSLVLFLGALLAYDRSVPFGPREARLSGAGGRPRSSKFYGLSLVLFLGALLAKTTTFSLPAVILLLRWWKEGCLQWRRDVRPTLPFFLMAAGFGLTTLWLEACHVGARGPGWDISWPVRCLVAGHILWFYAGKLFWPVNLCFIYPRWNPSPASPEEWLWSIAAIGVLLALWLARSRIGRGPAAAAFFFAGTLFPVLGFMNAYYMIYSFVCDHLAYLSSLGLIALSTAAIMRFFGWLQWPGARTGFTFAVLPVLFILTWRQSGMYMDNEILWRTTIARNSHCAMAYINLGNLILAGGNPAEAGNDFRTALEIEPENDLAHLGLGNVLLQEGQLDEALVHYRKAAESSPHLAGIDYDLGILFSRKGQMDEAVADFQKALALDPQLAPAYSALGHIALRRQQWDEAITNFQKAVDFNPDLVDAQNSLGRTLLMRGRLNEAIVHLQSVVQLQPDNVEAHTFLAWILATAPDASVRNGRRAVELAQEAKRLSDGRNPRVLTALAAAYAEAGRFSEAVATGRQALQLAADQSNPDLVNALQEQIGLYSAGNPFRDDSLTNAPDQQK